MSGKNKITLFAFITAAMLLLLLWHRRGERICLIDRMKNKELFYTEFKGVDDKNNAIYTCRAGMNKLDYRPGEKVKVVIDIDLAIDDLKERIGKYKALYAALSAERIFDANGNPHRFDNTGMSTLLTSTGMPIENTAEGIPHSKVGNSYNGFFELYTEKEMAAEIGSLESKHVHFELEKEIPKDLPDGYYRFEIDSGYITGNAARRWEFFPLHMAEIQARQDSKNKDFSNICESAKGLRQHHYSPVFRVGKPSQPRMIWMLLANEYSYEARGVAAEEDKNRFALNLNQTGPAFPIYPMRNPDGSYRVYNLEPDFPLENPDPLFAQDQMGINGKIIPQYRNQFLVISDPIPLNYNSGRLKVVVHTPSGATSELGDLPFSEKTETGASTNSGKFRYVFKEYGEYTIECNGWINDVWGHKYPGGGTYKIWIAEPLSFSTSTKPGMPFPAGASFSTRVTVHPAVPADIDFKVWLYRHSNPDDLKFMEYKGRANNFGYHYAIPAQKMSFDTPGEYRSEIVAHYVDGAGRLWMGAAINSSIVYDPNYKLKVHGDPIELILRKQVSPRYHMGREFVDSSLLINSDGNRRRAYDRQSSGNTGRHFPYNMEDVSMLALPRTAHDLDVLSMLTFEDPSGYWEKKIFDAFPPFYDYLAKSCPEALSILKTNFSWFDTVPMAVPDCYIADTTIIGSMHGTRETLRLLILSKNSIQPYDYPEKIKTMCYYYSSAIRPGLVARRMVADSTHARNYWHPFPNTFNRRLGYVSNGDMPTEEYRLIGGVVCKDMETGKYDNAPYQGALVFTEKGFNDDRVVAPFEEPLLEVAGRKMYAVLGASPEPGTIYETGDLISNGGLVFPITSMDFIWNITLPDGTVIAQRGRSNELGLAFPPKPVIPATLPGVYRVTQKLGKNGELGAVVGTGDDSFNIYVVEKNSPYKIIMEGPPIKVIDDLEKGVTIRGRIPSGISDPTLYHTVIMPGCVLAEGTIPIEKDGRFSYQFRPLDANVQCPNYDVVLGESRIPSLSDVVLFSFFLQGKDAKGKVVTAGRQVSIVNNRLITVDLGSLNSAALQHYYSSEERPNMAMMAHPRMIRFFYPGDENIDKRLRLYKEFESFNDSFIPKPSRLFDKDKLARLCQSCHSSEDVLSLNLDRGQWRRVLNFHWKKDPYLFDRAEYEVALRTLQSDFGTFWPVDKVKKRRITEGIEIYKKNCLACHGEMRVLLGSKYTSGWKNLIQSMSDMMDRPMSEEDKAILLEYLSWRQASEIDLSDIPALEQEKRWKKQRSLYQQVVSPVMPCLSWLLSHGLRILPCS